MSKPVIEVEGLSKRYRLGRPRPASTLQKWRNSLRRSPASATESGSTEDGSSFWALKDVSFAVQPGETLGIIGRNGAGKSTLLKILSRITEPSGGVVRIRGRVAALLEVGTGFHPDLTGRDNIYLNGQILGLNRREVQQRFDEIVEFSGVERFLDTQVKHFSSGMKTRLGFAVAAHLEPDVLIVDEVLAVGDAEFQRRCFDKMQALSANSGQTIIYVSHNHTSIASLCNRGLMMERGQLVRDGPAPQVITHYLSKLEIRAREMTIENRSDRLGHGLSRFVSIRVESTDGTPTTGGRVRFVFELDAPSKLTDCTFTVYSPKGHAIASFSTQRRSNKDDLAAPSSKITKFTCEFDELLLLPNRYRINAALSSHGELQDHLEGALYFDVEPGSIDGRPLDMTSEIGDLQMHHRWITESV